MGVYPPALSEIVMRALAPEPDERFPTMQAFQIALESFARASGLALSTVALAGFVQELFADELAAWQAAQREGKSLAEHLAAKPVVVASVDPADRTATDGFAPTKLRARRRARGARAAAVAGFVALCAVAGAMVTKRWKSDEPPVRHATGGAEITPRSAAPGAERNPATDPTAEKTLPPRVLPAVAASTTTTTATATTATNTKGKARVKPAVIRQGRAGATGQTQSPRPTAESRLGAWDPDSPVPP